MNNLFSTNYPEKVHNGDVELNTQKQVEEFGINNYTKINGNLTIRHFGKVRVDIVSLEALNSISFIENDLEISYNEQLINVDGLNNLTSIGGILNIENDSNLENLKGFHNLTTIGGSLSIGGTSIRNFNGLENLTNLGDGFFIAYNIQLTDFGSLQNLITNSNDSYLVYENGYNPSKKDIINGNCSL